MVAALRIVYEVVAFRVRRLEMANLAGAVSIMLVLRLPWSELCLRTLLAALLNALVYLNNDFHDAALDVASPDKDTGKAAYLLQHRREAVLAQWLIGGLLLALAASLSRGALLVLVAGSGTCFLYSAYFKHMPLMDVVAMTVWGVVMPLTGSPLDRTLGWALALQLGAFSSVFESLQVIRDHDADAQQGVRTTAVALGVPATLRLARALMLAAAFLGALVLHPLAGGLALAALLLRLRPGHADQLWTQVKMVYGVAWLVACGVLYVDGRGSGLLLSIAREATLPALAGVK